MAPHPSYLSVPACLIVLANSSLETRPGSGKTFTIQTMKSTLTDCFMVICHVTVDPGLQVSNVIVAGASPPLTIRFVQDCGQLAQGIKPLPSLGYVWAAVMFAYATYHIAQLLWLCHPFRLLHA